jgi:Bacterial PH domain
MTAVPAEGADDAATQDRQGHVSRPDARPATFRAVPTVALVAIGFLALCLSPIAFQGGPWFLLFLIPVAGAVWVVRSRTRVDAEGLHVRRFVGTRSLAWSEVTTLRLVERGWVHAVGTDDTDLELRGIRIRDLGRVGEASGGRISAPSPAEAEAAAEHARELEAARMRIARLRERQGAEGEDGVEAADEPEADAERPDDGTAEHETAQDEAHPGDAGPPHDRP